MKFNCMSGFSRCASVVLPVCRAPSSSADRPPACPPAAFPRGGGCIPCTPISPKTECVSTNPFRCTGEGRPSKALRAGQSVDKDGHPDCLRDGVRVATSFDDNEPRTAKSVTRILGAGMTYDGYIAV